MHSSWSGPRVAAAGLVLANLVPLFGIVAFGWTLHSLLVVYWLESGVVGAAYVAKIRRAEGEDDPEELPSWELNGRSADSFVGTSNGRIATFFLGHYGVFWAFHGLFVLYGFPDEFPGLEPASPRVVAVAAVSLAGYHAVSYWLNYLGQREYERNGPVTLMVEPYSRVFVLHVTIVLGAIPIQLFGAPAGALVVMVLVKTYFDLEAHRREHERARRRSLPSSASG